MRTIQNTHYITKNTEKNINKEKKTNVRETERERRKEKRHTQKKGNRTKRTERKKRKSEKRKRHKERRATGGPDNQSQEEFLSILFVYWYSVTPVIIRPKEMVMTVSWTKGRARPRRGARRGPAERWRRKRKGKGRRIGEEKEEKGK